MNLALTGSCSLVCLRTDVVVTLQLAARDSEVWHCIVPVVVRFLALPQGGHSQYGNHIAGVDWALDGGCLIQSPK